MSAEQKRKTVRQHGLTLPKFCECGGLMEYEFAFGRVFSACGRCTKVVKMKAK